MDATKAVELALRQMENEIAEHKAILDQIDRLQAKRAAQPNIDKLVDRLEILRRWQNGERVSLGGKEFVSYHTWLDSKDLLDTRHRLDVITKPRGEWRRNVYYIDSNVAGGVSDTLTDGRVQFSAWCVDWDVPCRLFDKEDDARKYVEENN